VELNDTIRRPEKSTAYYFLRSRVRYWLSRADQEMDPKKRFEFLEHARDFARKVRIEKGFTPWAAVTFAVVVVALTALWLASRMRATYFYSYPDNYLRIVRNVDTCLPDGSCGYRFVVQEVSKSGAGPETEMKFCRSMQPRFEAGHSLSWIRYTDLGNCQAINGYDVLRDSQRLPVLAPNCRPDYSVAKIAGHIVCDGGVARW